MLHEGWCFHKWFGVSVTKPATHRYPLSFCGTGEVILGTYCVLGGVLTLCLWHLHCAHRRCRGDRGWSLRSQRKALAPGGLSSPLALAGLLGKPGMETVEWGGGEQHRSKWAEEVLGRLLPSHWQDLVNVLPPRVAAQLTHTNLSPVHLPGRLRSQAVSIAGHERFPAGGERRMVGG